MGLKEDIKEMYRRLGVMEERVRQIQNLDIPKKGDVTKDLGKAKDQKEFDKKKKDWQSKFDKVDAGLKEVDSGIESFADQVKKVRTGSSDQWQDNTKLDQIDNATTSAEDMDKILKKAGLPSAFGELVKQLQAMRKDFLDKRNQVYKELKQEIDSMWKLLDEELPKFLKAKNGDLAAEKDALKNAKFGSGAKAKAGKK